MGSFVYTGLLEDNKRLPVRVTPDHLLGGTIYTQDVTHNRVHTSVV